MSLGMASSIAVSHESLIDHPLAVETADTLTVHTKEVCLIGMTCHSVRVPSVQSGTQLAITQHRKPV